MADAACHRIQCWWNVGHAEGACKLRGFVDTVMYLRTVITQPAMRTSLNVGFLIGCAFMLSMQMLTLSVLSAGNLAEIGAGGSPNSAVKATAAFSVLLFLGLAAFTAVLIAFRNALLPGVAPEQDTGPYNDDTIDVNQGGSVL